MEFDIEFEIEFEIELVIEFEIEFGDGGRERFVHTWADFLWDRDLCIFVPTPGERREGYRLVLVPWERRICTYLYQPTERERFVLGILVCKSGHTDQTHHI